MRVFAAEADACFFRLEKEKRMWYTLKVKESQ